MYTHHVHIYIQLYIYVYVYTHIVIVRNSIVIVLLFLLQGSRLKGLKYQGYTGYTGLTCFKRIEVIGIDHLVVYFPIWFVRKLGIPLAIKHGNEMQQKFPIICGWCSHRKHPRLKTRDFHMDFQLPSLWLPDGRLT